jgi:hypothetical protein
MGRIDGQLRGPIVGKPLDEASRLEMLSKYTVRAVRNSDALKRRRTQHRHGVGLHRQRRFFSRGRNRWMHALLAGHASIGVRLLTGRLRRSGLLTCFRTSICLREMVGVAMKKVPRFHSQATRVDNRRLTDVYEFSGFPNIDLSHFYGSECRHLWESRVVEHLCRCCMKANIQVLDPKVSFRGVPIRPALRLVREINSR